MKTWKHENNNVAESLTPFSFEKHTITVYLQVNSLINNLQLFDKS